MCIRDRFGGIFFPFDQLPQWAQIVGWCLPLSHMVQGTRDLVLGTVSWLTFGHAAALVALAALLFWLPIRMMGRRLID